MIHSFRAFNSKYLIKYCIRANKPPYQKGRDFKLIFPVPYPINITLEQMNRSLLIQQNKKFCKKRHETK